MNLSYSVPNTLGRGEGNSLRLSGHGLRISHRRTKLACHYTDFEVSTSFDTADFNILSIGPRQLISAAFHIAFSFGIM